ncbi:RNA polymerase sigma factor [Rubinisphaera margarita]|uniref:RNA polymerase sigma factor n=1 Tax=Rubinisphaera margarita TaxID=2909586 RepID=UPI001EE8E6D8|nr:sigma-70 family RNA polymerase sigma factor [Rubinisphaera margarita]MCG6158565.1 sigma-70 family RNA polymerase sigma factor [Rubinisphaera margarita]
MSGSTPPQRHFQTTCWSIIRRSVSPTVEGRAALEELCNLYWVPLYSYLRKTGQSRADAEDVVQGFFLLLFERDDLQKLSPERGRFRSFLLASLKNFLCNHRERDRALKRGGGKRPIPIDTAFAENRLQQSFAQPITAEDAFDREWALTVLEAVQARLRQEYESRGRQALHQLLASHATGHSEMPYRDIAQQVDMTEGAIKMAMKRYRKRFHELLREEISQTVLSEEDVDDEIRLLIAALQKSR